VPEIRTNEIYFTPVGTVEELRENNLSPKTFGSCSEPESKKNVGCPFWEECTMSYKGKSGPHYHGVRLVKHVSKGGNTIETIKPCFQIVGDSEQLRDDQTVQRITANEGEQITVNWTKPKPNPANPKMPINLPYIGKHTVPAYPRPGNNPDLLKFRYANMIYESDQHEREEDTYRSRAVGPKIEENMDVRHLYKAPKPEADSDGVGSDGGPSEGEEAPADLGSGEKRMRGRPRKNF